MIPSSHMMRYVTTLSIILLQIEVGHAFTFITPSPFSKARNAISKNEGLGTNTRLQSSSSDSTSFSLPTTISKDVLIIGGGLAGLSTALHLSTSSKRHVTLLERDADIYSKQNTAGSFAAAGMLAPQSERLPSGPLLDLCTQSRAMYPAFVSSVERLARESGEEGRSHLWKDDSDLKPWEVGFRSTGGFLAPAFAGDAVATWSPPRGSGVAKWLDEMQVRELEPELHPDVIGGWWFPEDASVDARRLTCSLRAACVAAGVHLCVGGDGEVTSLELSEGECKGVHLADGRILTAKSIIVANGSWMRQLLPVPITPHKGQSFSLQMPKNQPPILSRVLFAQDTYIVPKRDGRIVIGATVEPASFDASVTPEGMIHCMQSAIALVPGLAGLPIAQTWAGLRPTTPDKLPILGGTPWSNLYLAGGYWRNGVLLAPKAAQLLTDLISDTLSPEDKTLLEAFSWDRFTDPGSSAQLAVNTRYAASMHPLQKRSMGAAAVGTELGFYNDASTAREERSKDRKALFEEDEGKLEAAAKLGRRDGSAFSYPDAERSRAFRIGDAAVASYPDASPNSSTSSTSNLASSKAKPHTGESSTITPTTQPTESFDRSQALTVGSSTDETSTQETSTDETKDLSSIYEQIRINKSKAPITEPSSESPAEKRPELNFKIYRIDPVTGEQQFVPPYTPFAKLQDMNSDPTLTEEEGPIYDGYTAIQEANASPSREEELKKMKEARMQNRLEAEEIDESKIGVFHKEDGDDKIGVYPKEDGEDEEALEAAAELGKKDGSAFTYTDASPSLAGDAKPETEATAVTSYPDASPDSSTPVTVDDAPPKTEASAVTSSFAYPDAERSQAFTIGASIGGGDVKPASAVTLPTESSERSQALTVGASTEETEESKDLSSAEEEEEEIEDLSSTEEEEDTNNLSSSEEASNSEISTEEESKAETSTTDEEKEETKDLSSIYEQIRINKSKAPITEPSSESPEKEKKPELNFKIYRIDPVTGEMQFVPPYTSFAKLQHMHGDPTLTEEEGPIYDGYTAIQEANASPSREEELKKMKEARMQNRLEAESIDESNIGVFHKEDGEDEDATRL